MSERSVETKTIETSDGKKHQIAIIGSADVPQECHQTTTALVRRLNKSVEPVQGESNQDRDSLNQYEGKHPHPFDMHAAKDLTGTNPHHSTSLQVKRDATVGLGFESEGEQKQTLTDPMEAMAMIRRNPVETKVDKALDPLCDNSFQDVLNDVAEDFHSVGNGYVEVVRDKPKGQITGLYHIPGEAVEIYKHGGHRYHYVVTQDGEERHWPRFGRVDQFLNFDIPTGVTLDKANFSEVIPFVSSSSRDPYYGIPSWLSAVPDLEIGSALRQFKLDYYYNRGVPEYVFLYKGEMAEKEWEEVVKQLTGNVGLGKSHKSVCMKSPASPDTGLEIIRLAMDNFNGEEEFKDTKEALDLGIVTAHRVPPLIAGIQIPGKLGAANEFVQQLVSFQTLLIDHAQRLFQRQLGQTLGNEKFSNLGLTQDDFRFRRITDLIDPGKLDTVARMRQSPQGAAAQGRDVNDGTIE